MSAPTPEQTLEVPTILHSGNECPRMMPMNEEVAYALVEG
jgi:hypothetical protein